MPALNRSPASYRIALVLAGGNALGAYQAGVYQSLHEHGIEPDWVVGTSIGAINGAIIAGNEPEHRLARLTELWRPADAEAGWPDWWDFVPDSWRRTVEALGTMLGGRTGVFAPLGTSLDGSDSGTPAIYDTRQLKSSLAALVDFGILNSKVVRYAAVAVDLDSGEDALFDTQEDLVTAEHVRASAALPPAFPAVLIDGRMYVDGGLSANLPLDPVLSSPGEQPLLCIAVDLLPVAASRPQSLGEMIGRTQDLLFACQSRRTIERWKGTYRADGNHTDQSVTLVRLAYANQDREVAGKAMDFSPGSVRYRWDAGRHDGQSLAEDLFLERVQIGRPGLTVMN